MVLHSPPPSSKTQPSSVTSSSPKVCLLSFRCLLVGCFLKSFLSVVINSEKSAYLAPSFQARRRRTLKGLLDQIHEKFYGDAKKNEKPIESEAQMLSKAMTLIDPVTPEVVTEEKKWRQVKNIPDLDGAVLSGAHLGSRLVLGTKDGIFYWNGATLEQLRTDKEKSFQQIIVSDDYEMMVSLSAKPGKAAQIFHYDLQEIHGGSAIGTKMEETKGCSVFDLSVKADTGELILAALVKKTVMVYVWQSTTSSFLKIKDIPVPDQASLIKVINDSLFVGTRSEFLVLSLKDGTSTSIPLAENSAKIEPVAVVLLDKEVLISYNSKIFSLSFIIAVAIVVNLPCLGDRCESGRVRGRQEN